MKETAADTRSRLAIHGAGAGLSACIGKVVIPIDRETPAEAVQRGSGIDTP